MAPAFNVLFLCTQNSARSIIAEALLEKIGRGRFRAYSAGSAPAREPMPEVIERLAALGHDVSHLHSKSWDEFKGPHAPRMDFIIALCDAFDSMTSPTSYQMARPLASVVHEIEAGAGTQFDPELVQRFVALIDAGEIGGPT